MDLLAEGEHYTGTRGGSMDQAICLGARPDTAMKITFNPLRLEPVPLPEEWCFLVANSGVTAHKSAEARGAYNQRVRECGLALAMVAEAASLTTAGRSYEALLDQMPAEPLLASAASVLEPTLLHRFRHVVTEGARVEAAARAARANDRETFGHLMNASHDSLRDDFEVSCPELDELVELARSLGADGARLSGAGFGGAVVALCQRTRASKLAEDLRGFLRKRGKPPHPASLRTATLSHGEREYGTTAAPSASSRGNEVMVAEARGGASVSPAVPSPPAGPTRRTAPR